MTGTEDAPLVRFLVLGMPATAGSKRAHAVWRNGNPNLGEPARVFTGKINVRDDAEKRGKPWRVAVQHAARSAHVGPPLTGPLVLEVVFTLPRPKGHYGARGILPSAPTHPAVKPDPTKLVRALEDACSLVLWRDDAQIVEQRVVKRYGVDVSTAVTVWAAGRPALTTAPLTLFTTAPLTLTAPPVADEARKQAR